MGRLNTGGILLEKVGGGAWRAVDGFLDFPLLLCWFSGDPPYSF
jgi:hypothetical protein